MTSTFKPKGVTGRTSYSYRQFPDAPQVPLDHIRDREGIALCHYSTGAREVVAGYITLDKESPHYGKQLPFCPACVVKALLLGSHVLVESGRGIPTLRTSNT